MSNTFQEGQKVRILPNVFGGLLEGKQWVGRIATVVETTEDGEVYVECDGYTLPLTKDEVTPIVASEE